MLRQKIEIDCIDSDGEETGGFWSVYFNSSTRIVTFAHPTRSNVHFPLSELDELVKKLNS